MQMESANSNDSSSFSEELLLPVVDLSPFFQLEKENELEKRKCATEIHSAFSKFGGCYISGFENEVKTMFPRNWSEKSNAKDLSAVHQACKNLFSLSTTDKEKIPLIQPGGFTRGYIPIGGESGSYKFEKKEAFSYGENRNVIENPAENPLQGENAWPADEIFQEKLERNWKNTLVEFYEEICDVSDAVVKGMSLALGYDENYLGEFCKESRSISLMRLFHYLALNEEEKKKADGDASIIGSSEHTDWGFLTLILQPMSADKDTSKGLQFFHEGMWRDIPALPNTLVLNCGDYVSLITDSQFKSPLHRVVSSDADRISMVFFLYPSFDAKIPRMQLSEQEKPKLSLFENQKTTGNNNSNNEVDVLQMSFGSYILKKWDQVFRA